MPGSKYTKTRRGGKGGGGSGNLIILLIGIIAVAGLGYLAYLYVGSRHIRETDDETGCLKNAPTPQAVLFMVDQTDRLAADTALRIKQRIKDAVDTLPRYSRVIIVPFGGDTASPLIPKFNKCLPGRSSTASLDEGAQILDEQYTVFSKSLDAMVSELQAIPDSKTSPISAQVERAASDPELHWQGARRTIVLITDGLESSVYWTRDLKLKDPPEDLLRGVNSEYFEIGNLRNNKMQTRELRLEWKRWFEKAGSEVRITAPGFSAAGTDQGAKGQPD